MNQPVLMPKLVVSKADTPDRLFVAPMKFDPFASRLVRKPATKQLLFRMKVVITRANRQHLIRTSVNKAIKYYFTRKFGESAGEHWLARANPYDTTFQGVHSEANNFNREQLGKRGKGGGSPTPKRGKGYATVATQVGTPRGRVVRASYGRTLDLQLPPTRPRGRASSGARSAGYHPVSTGLKPFVTPLPAGVQQITADVHAPDVLLGARQPLVNSSSVGTQVGVSASEMINRATGPAPRQADAMASLGAPAPSVVGRPEPVATWQRLTSSVGPDEATEAKRLDSSHDPYWERSGDTANKAYFDLLQEATDEQLAEFGAQQEEKQRQTGTLERPETLVERLVTFASDEAVVRATGTRDTADIGVVTEEREAAKSTVAAQTDEDLSGQSGGVRPRKNVPVPPWTSELKGLQSGGFDSPTKVRGEVLSRSRSKYRPLSQESTLFIKQPSPLPERSERLDGDIGDTNIMQLTLLQFKRPSLGATITQSSDSERPAPRRRLDFAEGQANILPVSEDRPSEQQLDSSPPQTSEVQEAQVATSIRDELPEPSDTDIRDIADLQADATDRSTVGPDALVGDNEHLLRRTEARPPKRHAPGVSWIDELKGMQSGGFDSPAKVRGAVLSRSRSALRPSSWGGTGSAAQSSPTQQLVNFYGRDVNVPEPARHPLGEVPAGSPESKYPSARRRLDFTGDSLNILSLHGDRSLEPESESAAAGAPATNRGDGGESSQSGAVGSAGAAESGTDRQDLLEPQISLPMTPPAGIAGFRESMPDDYQLTSSERRSYLYQATELISAIKGKTIFDSRTGKRRLRRRQSVQSEALAFPIPISPMTPVNEDLSPPVLRSQSGVPLRLPEERGRLAVRRMVRQVESMAEQFEQK